MSYVLSKELCFEEIDLDVLKNKSVAIDISSIIYKSLYAFGNKKGPLTNESGRVTAHIYGVAHFLLKLKEHDILPIVCFDYGSPLLKSAVVEKRAQLKKSYCEKYENLKNIRSVSTKEVQRYNLANANITEMYKDILDFVKLCGLPYALEFGQQAEKLCAILYKNGIADAIFSADRDVTLYGCNTITQIDFKTKKMSVTNIAHTYYKLGLDNTEYLLCAIVAGNDYTKGVPLYGPKNAVNTCKKYGSAKLEQLCLTHNVPLNFIRNYINENLDLSFINRDAVNTEKLLEYLDKLDFSKNLISKICAIFALPDQPLEIKVS